MPCQNGGYRELARATAIWRAPVLVLARESWLALALGLHLMLMILPGGPG
jgi:hypothetical protein